MGEFVKRYEKIESDWSLCFSIFVPREQKRGDKYFNSEVDVAKSIARSWFTVLLPRV